MLLGGRSLARNGRIVKKCSSKYFKEEIVDETDVYIDVHKRIRAAAAAAASFVASAPSARRLTVQRCTVIARHKDPKSGTRAQVAYVLKAVLINQWKLRMNLAYLAAIADSQPQTPVVHSQLHISNERVAFCKDRPVGHGLLHRGMDQDRTFVPESMFASADSIKSFLLVVQVTFLLIMFLLVMFSFLLTEIESADYVSAGHVLVPADRDRIC
ncbi:hypothetical protein Tco_0105556 [Tanacetum coccineum]